MITELFKMVQYVLIDKTEAVIFFPTFNTSVTKFKLVCSNFVIAVFGYCIKFVCTATMKKSSMFIFKQFCPDASHAVTFIFRIR